MNNKWLTTFMDISDVPFAGPRRRRKVTSASPPGCRSTGHWVGSIRKCGLTSAAAMAPLPFAALPPLGVGGGEALPGP